MGSLCVKSPPKQQQSQQHQQRLTANGTRTLSVIREEAAASTAKSTPPATVRLTDPPNHDQSSFEVNAPQNADGVRSTESRGLVRSQDSDRHSSPSPPVQSVDKKTNVDDDNTKDGCNIEVEVRNGHDPVQKYQSIATNERGGGSHNQLVEGETGREQEPFQEAHSKTSCRMSDDSGIIDGRPHRYEQKTSTSAEPGPSFHATPGHDEPEILNSVVSVISRSSSSVSDTSTLATVSVDEKPTTVDPPNGNSRNIRPAVTAANVSQIGENKANGTEPNKNNLKTINDRTDSNPPAKPRLGITQQRALLDGPDISRFRIF